MFDVPGIHVLWVEIDDRQRLVVTVESDQLEAGCPSCGVVAAGYGRRVHPLHDAPCFDRVTLVRGRKRIWRCREPMCATTTFRGAHDLTWPRAVLTTRAVECAADALTHDDTNVSALGRWRYSGSDTLATGSGPTGSATPTGASTSTRCGSCRGRAGS